MSRRGRRQQKRSWAPWLVLGLVAVTAIVGYLIYMQAVAPTPQDNQLVGKPVPSNVINEIAGVSFNTLNTVGKGGSGVSSPQPITSATTPLTLNGKPEILYIGAEYCPFCAVERWSIMVALSKFGNFSGLDYMLSSPTDTPSSVPTFTFAGATYASNYLSFVAVEQTDRFQKPLQSVTPDQQALMNAYDPQGSIPFIDFGNKYSLVGSQFQPPFPGNANWTQIASQLDSPGSPIAQNIDGAANRVISLICQLTNGQPTNVCSQQFAQTLSFTGNVQHGGELLIASVVPAMSAEGTKRVTSATPPGAKVKA